MSEEQKLREIIETNFRLGILHTQQVGVRLERRMDGLGNRMDSLSTTMSAVASAMKGLSNDIKTVGNDIKTVGTEMKVDFDSLADQQSETLDVLRKVGDSSVDLRKEIQDLKRRVTDLEDKDKAS